MDSKEIVTLEWGKVDKERIFFFRVVLVVSNTSWIKVLVFILLDKEEDVLQRKKQCLPRQQSLMLLPMFRHHLGGSKANTYSVEESDWKEKEKEKRAKNIILGNAKA